MTDKNNKYLILNGPNLNLLGTREPEIYGTQTFEDYFKELSSKFSDLELTYYQSNSEGALIDKLHEVGFTYAGVVFNPGGYTHTSVALHDAIKAITTPVMEVHISDIHNREDFRKQSITSLACVGMISGLGIEGYAIALERLVG